jgi:hypothetical protein
VAPSARLATTENHTHAESRQPIAPWCNHRQLEQHSRPGRRGHRNAAAMPTGYAETTEGQEGNPRKDVSSGGVGGLEGWNG